MRATSLSIDRPGVLRVPQDAWLLGLAAVHAVVLVLAPSAPIVAIGMWWNANTIAHNAIHRPLFREPALNRALGVALSLLLGLPQSLWRERHLAHHAGRRARAWHAGVSRLELVFVTALWGSLALLAPRFLATAYLPGFLAGLVLCWLQGYYEHARGVTSHYGALYNFLFLNDGYHVEHHERPATLWTALPSVRRDGARASRWPAVLRFLDALSLAGLERCVLRSARLQRFVLGSHARALARVADELPRGARVGIVGGALYPRTALALGSLRPDLDRTIIDGDAAHVAIARKYLGDAVRFETAWYDPARHQGFDCLIFPLAYVGNRDALYERPDAPVVLVHDWIWNTRGVEGAIVSPLLLKRVNVVKRRPSAAESP